MPAEQTSFAAHFTSQAPQLLGSKSVCTHEPLQSVEPGHTFTFPPPAPPIPPVAIPPVPPPPCPAPPPLLLEDDVEDDVVELLLLELVPLLVVVVVSSPQPTHAVESTPSAAAQANTLRPEPPKAEIQLFILHPLM